MAMQYKPTKQKKEKPAKAPKAPKAEKAVKLGAATKVKAAKPAKAPKPPKAPKVPKEEKAVAFKPGKVESAASLEKGSVLKKPVNTKIVVAIVAAIILITVVVVALVVPAIKRNGQLLDGIIIETTPIKTIYLIGEEADYNGLRVAVSRKNGDTFIVRASDCEISGFDSTTAGYKTINVVYEGFASSFSIKVEEPERPVSALKSISLKTLPKTEYKVGEWLDTTGGMLVREYIDGTTAEITLVNSYVYGFGDIEGPGTYTLTVEYEENGIIETTEYQITVTE